MVLPFKYLNKNTLNHLLIQISILHYIVDKLNF